MPEAPRPGGAAPAFRLTSTEGEISLHELLATGNRLVLAFYHEDATPSCETQISMLRDAHEMLTEFDARVVAVSADSLTSHQAFAERLGGLPFPLASDGALDVARAYGVVDAGDPRRSQRAIFVIDRDGTVLLSIQHYQPSNLAQVKAIFSALGADA
jgi:peroxiredoxin (alkyl hydroperoxide reductase subunit C)